VWVVMAVLALSGGPGLAAKEGAVTKTRSVLFPQELRERVRANAARYPWAREMQAEIVARAQPWREMSDEALWQLMFGSTITRSWMVWSNGRCPSCHQDVPMYQWQMDALGRPWKVRCPHCQEEFPKNDFAAYYQSGRDAHGVFDPTRADRNLLFNTDHPDPQDPLHTFGVDDGEGYVNGSSRWRFIGAYLIYGQWKQAVLAGISNLAAAYAVTGEQVYAHKAGILLDRVADLYPNFDYKAQGLVYEQPGSEGYVSVWHDACEETRQLVLAYDQVFDGLKGDAELVSFLAAKARQYSLPNPKRSFADVQRNLETGILDDARTHRPKIESNYPRTDVTLATIEAVLGWPANRERVYAMLTDLLGPMTAVDGVSGEKGLAGYASYATQGTAEMLARFSRLDPGFLAEMLKRQPRLCGTFRFHLDTMCLNRYYPSCGDSGAFAQPVDAYVGVSFDRNPGTAPSMYSFLWDWYHLTGDAGYVQALYRANGGTAEGLPHDLTAADPEAVARQVEEVIQRVGPTPDLSSVNEEQWHLALLRAGHGAEARVAWLDYDAGGRHSHADSMNLGLFAKGLDLLPDFGYPPVQYGGWGTPEAEWYMTTVSHNTVVVDGKRQGDHAAKTTLWAEGESLHAVRAEAPPECGADRFERTVVMVDTSARDSYLLDVFRVAGGADHAKFLTSHFGTLTTQGLSLAPGEEYGHGAIMRNFQTDARPAPGWWADWQVGDRYHLLPAGVQVHLRYTDLTEGAQATVAEAWVIPGSYQEPTATWVPRVMVRRQAATGPLVSTFVGVLDPYEAQPQVAGARRLAMSGAEGDASVAVEVTLADGRQDLLLAADPKAQESVEDTWQARTDAQLVLVRRDPAGQIERVAISGGTRLRVGELEVQLAKGAGYVEIRFLQGRAEIAAGKAREVAHLRLNGHDIKLK
jgi:oligo-alginate lyase